MDHAYDFGHLITTTSDRLRDLIRERYHKPQWGSLSADIKRLTDRNVRALAEKHRRSRPEELYAMVLTDCWSEKVEQ